MKSFSYKISFIIMNRRVVEVVGIELATPNGLQLYDIIRYNNTNKIANGTDVMG